VLQQKQLENFNFDIGCNMVPPLYETHIRINILLISTAQRTPVGKCVQLINVINLMFSLTVHHELTIY